MDGTVDDLAHRLVGVGNLLINARPGGSYTAHTYFRMSGP